MRLMWLIDVINWLIDAQIARKKADALDADIDSYRTNFRTYRFKQGNEEVELKPENDGEEVEDANQK